MVAFTDSQGNVLITASEVAGHVKKLVSGQFLRSYGPSPDFKIINNYYSRYSSHLDKEGGGNFCDYESVNSPQGDGAIIYPLGVPGSQALAQQDIKAWNAIESNAMGLPERFQ